VNFDSLLLLEGANDCGNGLQSRHKRCDGGDDLANHLNDASKAELLLFGGFSRKIHFHFYFYNCVVYYTIEIYYIFIYVFVIYVFCYICYKIYKIQKSKTSPKNSHPRIPQNNLPNFWTIRLPSFGDSRRHCIMVRMQ